MRTMHILHDICHSFASRALALGESLPVIGKLLGHSQIQTTARYAHLARDSMKASASRLLPALEKICWVPNPVARVQKSQTERLRSAVVIYPDHARRQLADVRPKRHCSSLGKMEIATFRQHLPQIASAPISPEPTRPPHFVCALIGAFQLPDPKRGVAGLSETRLSHPHRSATT